MLCVEVLLRRHDTDLYVPDHNGCTVLDLVRVGKDRSDIRKSIMTHLKRSFRRDAQGLLNAEHPPDSSSSSGCCSDEYEDDEDEVLQSPVTIFSPLFSP